MSDTGSGAPAETLSGVLIVAVVAGTLQDGAVLAGFFEQESRSALGAFLRDRFIADTVLALGVTLAAVESLSPPRTFFHQLAPVALRALDCS